MALGDAFASRLELTKLLERTVVTSPLGSGLANNHVVEDFDAQPR